MPEIEPYLEGQKVIHRFVGLWSGQHAKLSGLFVLTDKNILFKGKPKIGFWSSSFEMIASGYKQKNVMIIPINSIEQVIQKKNVFVIIFSLAWMGGKYAEKGKKDKTAIEIFQGKERSLRESKKGLLLRANKFVKYIEEYVPRRVFFK